VTPQPEPELREPDLPRTAKVRPRALRTGWTTGTCASAAAKAATTALRDQRPQDMVDVALHDVGGFTAEDKDAILFNVAMIVALLLKGICDEAGSDLRRAWPRVIADLTRAEEL